MTNLKTAPELRPMASFDPTRPSVVYDELNDELFRWRPDEWEESYARYASRHAEGVVEWDGLLLAGWYDADLVELSPRGEPSLDANSVSCAGATTI
jgi:hypothetical protein